MQNGNKPNWSIHIRENAKKLNGVYTGSIENGMDLMRIEEWFLNIEKKKKKSKKVAINDIDFITLAKASCDQKFISKL
jgi:hypothetical protein